MQRYISIYALIIVVIVVLSRVFVMNKNGIKAMRFGEKDKSDFLIPPAVLALFYVILTGILNIPKVGTEIINIEIIGWIGVTSSMLGMILFILSLISFGKSFRVGIDDEKPGALITTGVFAVSRNPIYTAFVLILLGIFLTYSNWIILLYLFGFCYIINRQVLREEESLKKIYGAEYLEYCKKVRRYI